MRLLTNLQKTHSAIHVDVQNTNVNSAVEEFGKLNGVSVYSSIDLPTGVNAVYMEEE